jgi:hypothetical protein
MREGSFETNLREALRDAAGRTAARPAAASDVIRRSQPVRFGVPVGMVVVAVGVAFGAGGLINHGPGGSSSLDPAGFGSTLDETSPPSPTPESETPPYELIDEGVISGEPWKLFFWPNNRPDGLCPQFGLGYDFVYEAAGECPAEKAIDSLIVSQLTYEDFPSVAPVYGLVSKEAVEVTIQSRSKGTSPRLDCCSAVATVYPGPEDSHFNFFLGFVPSPTDSGEVIARNASGRVLQQLPLCMPATIESELRQFGTIDAGLFCNEGV